MTDTRLHICEVPREVRVMRRKVEVRVPRAGGQGRVFSRAVSPLREMKLWRQMVVMLAQQCGRALCRWTGALQTDPKVHFILCVSYHNLKKEGDLRLCISL